jgi:hypothetical protein
MPGLEWNRQLAFPELPAYRTYCREGEIGANDPKRACLVLMGAVRLMMNLPSPWQLPAQAQCNATDQLEGANSTACDCVRSGTPPVLLKPLWAGSAHVVQFRPVVIE